MKIFKTTIEIWSHDNLVDAELEDVILQSIQGNCRGIEQSVASVEFTEMQNSSQHRRSTMGQYWYPVNLTKREFINPHKLGSGLKLWEQIANPGVGQALVILSAAMPERRGGGDFNKNDEISARTIGRWAGDRIALVGDYAEDGDLPKHFKASKILNKCDPKARYPYKDITDDVCHVIEQELNGKFEGDGWRSFKSNEVS